MQHSIGENKPQHSVSKINTHKIKRVLWFALIFVILGIHTYAAISICASLERITTYIETPVTPQIPPVSNVEEESIPPVSEDSDTSEEEIEVSDEVSETVSEEISETIREPLGMGQYEKKYLDIPLDTDLQDYIFENCKERDVDPFLVFAIIKKESGFRVDVNGDGGESYGLMQIKLKYQYERMERLGCSDLADPYDNVLVGIDILQELFTKGKPVEYVLMSYNGGAKYANRKWAAGEISDYAKTVIEWRNEFERELYAG